VFDVLRFQTVSIAFSHAHEFRRWLASADVRRGGHEDGDLARHLLLPEPALRQASPAVRIVG